MLTSREVGKIIFRATRNSAGWSPDLSVRIQGTRTASSPLPLTIFCILVSWLKPFLIPKLHRFKVNTLSLHTENGNSSWNKCLLTPIDSLRSWCLPTPRWRRSRLFSCVVPRWWNDLPSATRTGASPSIYKLLKTQLIREHLLPCTSLYACSLSLRCHLWQSLTGC